VTDVPQSRTAAQPRPINDGDFRSAPIRGVEEKYVVQSEITVAKCFRARIQPGSNRYRALTEQTGPYLPYLPGQIVSKVIEVDWPGLVESCLQRLDPGRECRQTLNGFETVAFPERRVESC